MDKEFLDSLFEIKKHDQNQGGIFLVRVRKSLELVQLNEDSRGAYKILYVLLCKQTQRIKIGVTDNLKNRFREIQSTSATPLVIVFECLVEGFEVEKYLHRKFRKHRLHGEWFAWTDELKNEIAALDHCHSVLSSSRASELILK